MDAIGSKPLVLYTGVNPTYTAGKVGNCVVFNTTSLSTAIGTYLITSVTFSISFWIRTDANTQYGWAGVIAQGADSGFGLIVHVIYDNQLWVTHGDASSHDTGIRVNSTWQHIVITSDITGANYYSNNVKVNSHTTLASNTDGHNNVGRTTIGCYTNLVEGNYYFNGMLDELYISDKVITSTEIDALYNLKIL